MNRPTVARRGVALVIALAVLAALLFLALPFLYSQTASVAGARAAGWDGTARAGQAAAENVAAATAVYAVGLLRSPGMQATAATATYTSFPPQIANVLGIYASADSTVFRTILDTGQDWTDAAGSTVLRPKLDDPAFALHGAVIEDEGRRIDPNGLGERAWAVILERAGIKDPYTIRWVWTPRTPPGVTGNPLSYGDWRMVNYGRLARALSRWRPGNTGARYTQLTDLIGADPSSSLGTIPFGPPAYDLNGNAAWPYASIESDIANRRNADESDALVISEADATTTKATLSPVTGMANLGYRKAALTQAELERLRPFLTFHQLGQGRGGMVDLGSVLAIDPRADYWDSQGVLTDLPVPMYPTDKNASDVRPLWRNGAWIRDADGHAHFDGFWQDKNSTIAQLGEGLALPIQPELSINAVPGGSSLTLLYLPADALTHAPAATDLRPRWWPVDPSQAPVESMHGMPLLRWLDPRNGDGSPTGLFERPALGVASWGIVSIEGAALSVDPSGHAQAQRRRRVVMQTVPHERPVEVSWTSQAELESLVRQRHTSWMVAGPHPTNRIANWGAGDTDDDASGVKDGIEDMDALGHAGWLEPAPLAAFSENQAVSFDWKVPLGLNKPVAWADVLRTTTTPVETAVMPSLAELRGTAGSPGVLTPQGLRVTAAVPLAWTVSDTAGPLRFAANDDPGKGIYWHEASARHVSLRFAFPSAPSGTVTLFEVRSQGTGGYSEAKTPGLPIGAPGAQQPDTQSDEQSVWRVEYRPADHQLVLILANAALPWRDAALPDPSDRRRFGVAAWTMKRDDPTAAQDDRCLPDAGGMPFAPADPATRVEFRYHVEPGVLASGTWHHLQILCAGDQPGMHGLILDGIVGRDAIAAAAMNRTGDHFTWPSMRLATKIDAVDVATAGGAILVSPNTITVALPPGQTIDQILPARGLVRIDDEYFSYTAASGTTLTGVQRARRVNTNQAGTEDANDNGTLDAGEDADGDGSLDTTGHWARWPATQAHAEGTLVTPGWSWQQIGGGGATYDWLRGQVALAAPFQPQPTEGTVNTAGWPIPSANHLEFPATVTVTTTVGTWPSSGLVRFRDPVGGGVHVAAFTAAGSVLTLDWTGSAEVSGANPAFADTITGFDCLLLTMSVGGGTGITDQDVTGDGTVDQLFVNSGALQLLSLTDGRCEWVRFKSRVDRDADVAAATVKGRYFLRDDGWKMVVPYDGPLSRSRGAMRTPWRDVDAWPVGTIVLPVQTRLTSTDRFESGDVATIVPVNRSMTTPPVQVVVRHAARDGFPAAVALSGADWDTTNEWFALAHRVPDILPDPDLNAQVALIGRGWSGDDLSMIANTKPRHGALPRLDEMLSAAGTARVYIGCADPGGMAASGTVLIDDLAAGEMTALADGNVAAPASRITSINGAATGSIPDTAGALPVRITTGGNIFHPVQTNLWYGLVWIDGEVFAYRRESSSQVVLVARALLGSERMVHTLGPAGPLVPDGGSGPPIRTVSPMLQAIVLPMGPVAELCSGIVDTLGGGGADIVECDMSKFFTDPEALLVKGWEPTKDDDQFLLQAPMQYVTDPDGVGTMEVMRLFKRPSSNQHITARWLRGLYGTISQVWSATAPAVHNGQPPLQLPPPNPPVLPTPATVTWPALGSGIVNPIVIGWWPRFAPGLPAGGGLTNDERSAQLRSRVFAWAGFPLRLHGSRFDPGIPVLDATLSASEISAGMARAGIADIPVALDAGCGIQARALATGTTTAEIFDWQAADASATALAGGSANAGLTAPFNWARFHAREVDGAELRVHWSPPAGGTTLDSVALAQGVAPRLGADDTQAQSAPDGTAAIRLRCVAPTRVLAVEEVR